MAGGAAAAGSLPSGSFVWHSLALRPPVNRTGHQGANGTVRRRQQMAGQTLGTMGTMGTMGPMEPMGTAGWLGRRGRAGLAAALAVCWWLAATGFSLDRPRHADFSQMSWSAAFSALCARLAREYPFTAWKGLDWAATEAELAPRAARAEAQGDARAWYRVVRELVWRMRDGHAHVLGDDHGLARDEAGGSFGLQLAELDDGRFLAVHVAPGGPADRAGVRFGAQVQAWNGQPVEQALAGAPVLWSDRPPATRAGLRLIQERMIGRAPVGAHAQVRYRNRGDRAGGPPAAADADLADLVATAAPPDGPPCLHAGALLFGRTYDARELAAGAGYVRLRFELPTLRTLLPGLGIRWALAHFAADGLPGVVLDVRGNCGGADAWVPPVVAPFVRHDLFYEVPGIFRAAAQGRFLPDPRQAVDVREHPPVYRGRIAVLIDGDTVSAGEAIPYLLKGQPDTRVIGFQTTQGSFGIGEKSIRLPAGLEVVYPHAQSLDASGVVEVDGDAAGRGGVEPDQRLPLTAEAVERWLGQGEDLALDAAVRYVRGQPPPDGAVPDLPR